jgi:hypothetical protein
MDLAFIGAGVDDVKEKARKIREMRRLLVPKIYTLPELPQDTEETERRRESPGFCESICCFFCK